jgi:hypothetical protein
LPQVGLPIPIDCDGRASSLMSLIALPRIQHLLRDVAKGDSEAVYLTPLVILWQGMCSKRSSVGEDYTKLLAVCIARSTCRAL